MLTYAGSLWRMNIKIKSEEKRIGGMKIITLNKTKRSES